MSRKRGEQRTANDEEIRAIEDGMREPQRSPGEGFRSSSMMSSSDDWPEPPVQDHHYDDHRTQPLDKLFR